MEWYKDGCYPCSFGDKRPVSPIGGQEEIHTGVLGGLSSEQSFRAGRLSKLSLALACLAPQLPSLEL